MKNYEKNALDRMKREVVSGALRHWRRMLAWASRQDPGYCAGEEEMEASLGEAWTDAYCDLCQYDTERAAECAAERAAEGSLRDACRYCPLAQAYGRCKHNPEFLAVEGAATWGEWVNAANRFLTQIEGLEGGENEY